MSSRETSIQMLHRCSMTSGCIAHPEQCTFCFFLPLLFKTVGGFPYISIAWAKGETLDMSSDRHLVVHVGNNCLFVLQRCRGRRASLQAGTPDRTAPSCGRLTSAIMQPSAPRVLNISTWEFVWWVVFTWSVIIKGRVCFHVWFYYAYNLQDKYSMKPDKSTNLEVDQYSNTENKAFKAADVVLSK